ncbi:MAG: hypothetical protein Q8M92_08590 [Candidatus Subteraquimicrobiales bacterium]|nr:hypothetical protein [Candidatus Subteraquimicrobiales bacterium]
MYRDSSSNPLLILLRDDLGDPGLTIAQACHAVYEFGRNNHQKQTNEYIYVLRAPKDGIELMAEVLEFEREPFALFREPDMNNEATALCCSINPGRLSKYKKF